ncbi:MAG: hypothetical protein QXH27_02970 [Candidatus Micrarchaeia archaeon]
MEKPIQLLEQEARKNAAIEQANRLTAVRAIARGLHAGWFAKEASVSWKIEFTPRELKKVFSPLVDDLARLRRDKGVVMYGVKDTASIAEKKRRLVDGALNARKPAGAAAGEALKQIRKAAEELGSEVIVELVDVLGEKDETASELFKFAAGLRKAPDEEVARLLREVGYWVKNAAPEDRRIDHAKFVDRVLLFAERKWPVTKDEADALTKRLDGEKRAKLSRFVEGYLEVEKKNLLRGSLEYSLYERFLELINAFMLREETGGNEEDVRELHGRLSVLGEIIDSIEKKSRMLKTILNKDCPEIKFVLLCELARLRSDLLEFIKNFSSLCCKKKPEGYECVLYSLSGLFFDFTATSPKEAELWESFLGAFKRELDRSQRRNIRKYIGHLKSIQALPEAAVIESEQKKILDAKKTERVENEKRLLESIRDLALAAPVEGEIILRAYLEIKSHVRYKLGDWLYPPEAYLTPEKTAEVILRMIHAMKKRGANYSVFGKPLTEYEEYVRKLHGRLLEHNKRIYALCEEIPANAGDSVAHALNEAADSIGYVPENIFDAVYDIRNADGLLRKGARDSRVVFEYSERLSVGGRRIVSLWMNGAGEPIEVELAPVEFAHEFKKSGGIKEATVGKKFDVVIAALKVEENSRHRPEAEEKSAYALLADYVSEHADEIFDSEREVRNPASDLFLVACSAQRELNGITTRFGENPPKFMGENELEKNLRQRLGEGFEKQKERVKAYLEAERITAMLDEIHIRQREIIIRELAWLRE